MLAYATTVHKAQGSEYPAVVMPVTTQHYPMLQRNLLYTGVTRGPQLVVLVAQPRAVAIAVKGRLARRRWSKLGEWLTRRASASSFREHSLNVLGAVLSRIIDQRIAFWPARVDKIGPSRYFT